ncbi:hypothetical protein V8C86DRAFT_2629536 [Haematococcus lacustris]
MSRGAMSTVLAAMIAICLLAEEQSAANSAHTPPWLSSFQQQPLSYADERSEALRFLNSYMPQADKGRVSAEILTQHTDLALAARHSSPWALSVPWALFLNNVLPYASLDEPRDEWRQLFVDRLAPLVAGATSSTQAAQILNAKIWDLWGIRFKADQTPDIMSPAQVIAAGYASCTGLSIFLVAACRAVGIPARVAGTPEWAATLPSWGPDVHLVGGRGSAAARKLLVGARAGAGGQEGPPQLAALGTDVGHDFNNHNWVEVWDDDAWSFMGAAEYNPQGLNRTWFFPNPAKQQIPWDKYHAIYAASFAPTPGYVTYPLVWSPGWLQPGWDVTQAYLDAQVLDR